MNLPGFLSDSNKLGSIGTIRWSNDPLMKPGVKTFMHLFLKLPMNCPVWEVYRLVSASGNSMG